MRKASTVNGGLSEHLLFLIFYFLLILLLLLLIIMIAFTGTPRDFYNLLTARRTASITYAQVALAQSCANHMQYIKCVLRATWYKGTIQLLSLTELKSHLFELHFIG